jgi:branched-subunit amino acid permease
MKGSVYTNKLMIDDPLFFHKSSLISSSNYLHDKAREDKDRLYSKFYFAISLVSTIFASLFIGLISALLLANLLTVLLILSVKKYKKHRKTFQKNRKIMEKSFQDFGLEWKG